MTDCTRPGTGKGENLNGSPGGDLSPGTVRLAARWRDDDRGTSMITTAVTLPLLIVLFMGIFYLSFGMFHRWMLRQGTLDAAQYISEQGRYWNINPASADGELLPADWYDIQARRIIGSRLRDMLPYSAEQITATLIVTVTEPLLATGAVEGDVCDPGARGVGDMRLFEEAGFMVEARFAVPFWSVRIPYADDFGRKLVFRERAVGHLQCPRWMGGRGAQDESQIIGGQGPAIPFRDKPGPLQQILPPTVTAVPSLTPTPVPPTETPTPTTP